MQIEKYTFGVGDRFARQAKPQLRACMQAAEEGVEVIPTWNKSHREHLTVGTRPPQRAAGRGFGPWRIWIGTSPTTSMQITSTSTPSTSIWKQVTSSRSTSRTRSADHPSQEPSTA